MTIRKRTKVDEFEDAKVVRRSRKSRCTASDYSFGIFKLVYFCSFSFGHCVVSPSSMYDFWLLLWHLQTRLLLFFFFWSLCCLSLDLRLLLTTLVWEAVNRRGDNTMTIRKRTKVDEFEDAKGVVRSRTSKKGRQPNDRFTASPYHFGIFKLVYFCSFSFVHCVVSPSIYGFSLPLWYLQTRLLLFFFFWSLGKKNKSRRVWRYQSGKEKP
jgi:hypothetical protein